MLTGKQKKSKREDEPEGLNQTEQRLQIERKRLVSDLPADVAPPDELVNGWPERDSSSEREVRDLEYVHRGAIRQRIIRIDRALERIEAGTYGLCDGCGKRIDRRRLSHEPGVEFCLACQKEFEAEIVPSTM
jgi:RNA polymerase-binding transcription factor DksA